MQLSVIIPVKNEEENIVPLLTEIDQALKSIKHEIIYIDDSSTDQTLDILKKSQKKFKQLRVLSHAKSVGQSGAIYSGLKVAKAPIIATLDGDGQNDPKDILQAYKVYQALDARERIGMVIGRRQKRQDSPIRMLSSKVANGVRSWMLQDGTKDSGCGLKVLSRDLFLSLPYFDHMHRFMPSILKREGYTSLSVPISHRSRQTGVSKYGINNRLWVGIVDLFGVMWLLKRRRRTSVKEI